MLYNTCPNVISNSYLGPTLIQFTIRVILLSRSVLERILDERLSVLKTIEAVDREFNITDPPVSDLRDISGKRN